MGLLLDTDLPAVDLYVPRDAVETEGRTVNDVLADLNHRLHDAGQKSGKFTWLGCSDVTYGGSEKWPSCRIICSAARGRNEAYYVDLIAWDSAGPGKPKMISAVKCWSWQEAVTLSALTVQLLDITS